MKARLYLPFLILLVACQRKQVEPKNEVERLAAEAVKKQGNVSIQSFGAVTPYTRADSAHDVANQVLERQLADLDKQHQAAASELDQMSISEQRLKIVDQKLRLLSMTDTNRLGSTLTVQYRTKGEIEGVSERKLVVYKSGQVQEVAR
ncbi:hypothetical protein [Hymenobacter rigui]|uniref:Uncharacterized protein n=1 Tax=Hymenobacter rigui TaxID=334424 RepID=A0A3R9NLX4_9BACT|nr:hypothetical protein [Hymenobacter rigui]RSK50121.1 hypothetical protein EI291_05570 [Hymenobacter rigui]